MKMTFQDQALLYHYPQIPENILRKQGEYYFKSYDLTGSKEGTSRKPKISLNAMNEIFDEKGWLLFNQPSQSPVTNVHDACIFQQSPSFEVR